MIKNRLISISLMLLAICLTADSVCADTDNSLEILSQIERGVERISGSVGSAVVSISTERTDLLKEYQRSSDDDVVEQFFRNFLYGEIPKRKYKHMGLGSGVLIDAQGHIITNEHIINGADKITVTLGDGRRFFAHIKASDFQSDLAIIKIEANELPWLELGDSNQLKAGQWAIAVGNPFGFSTGNPEPSFSFGVVSALHRSLPRFAQRDRVYYDLIQTDATITPGNSGGPLVNLKGEVIGINLAVHSPGVSANGIGFAIPVNYVRAIFDRLLKGEEILYDWLGIRIHDLNPALANYFGMNKPNGVLIADVSAGSIAEKAGFQEQDVIVKFGEDKIENTLEFIANIENCKVGQKVKVKVNRRTLLRELNLIIGKRPSVLINNKKIRASISTEQIAGAKKEEFQKWRGMSVSPISPEGSDDGNADGVLVIEVAPDSPAYDAGIRKDDILNRIDTQEIHSIDDYEKAVTKASGSILVKTENGYLVIRE
ncbi:MAG: trypsin-like peptidase domain-containing protein [Candidatus Omnitrophota bacterium]